MSGWNRFTKRARNVISLAQEAAERLGFNEVAPEHLWLGLLAENDNVASRVLNHLGFSGEAIREEIERRVPRGANSSLEDKQLTSDARKVIERSVEEADRIGNAYVGAEHLLLALLTEKESVAGRVLAEAGVELTPVREMIMALQDTGQ